MKPIPPFSEVPMFFISSGIYTTTVFLIEGVDFELQKIVNLNLYPDITITYPSAPNSRAEGGFNGMCYNGQTADFNLQIGVFATIYMDFAKFPFLEIPQRSCCIRPCNKGISTLVTQAPCFQTVLCCSR